MSVSLRQPLCRLTPAARQYLMDLRLYRHPAPARSFPAAPAGGARKPEHMTNLNAKQLVLKNHPRIILRGKIDTFQAKTLEVQILADELGHRNMVNMLGEVNDYARKILVADLMDKPLDDSITLIGLNEQELRFVSQHPTQYFGVGHIAPSYKMGKLAVELNLLRAMSREVELAAINAFADGEVKIERKDILRALNRLSSALYIMYLEVLAEGGES